MSASSKGHPVNSLAEQLLLLFTSWLIIQFFWRKRTFKSLYNIPGPPSDSFWSGNTNQFFTRHGASFQSHVAFDYGPIVRLHGLFGRPMLYISDPKALHNILVKEEPIYQESSLFIRLNYLVFGRGLLATLGEQHRKQRKMLNPVFSVNHMRRLTPIFYDIIHKASGILRAGMAAEVSKGAQELDALHWFGRAALELIGQGGLGYSFDPLTEQVPNAYGDAFKAIGPAIQGLNSHVRLLHEFAEMGPAWLRRAVMKVWPSKRMRDAVKIVDTMDMASKQVYESKKLTIQAGDEALLQRIGQGKDIMSVLMKDNMKASKEDRLPESEIIGQMTTLMFAATDTTSNTLCRILQLLATYPDVQQELREELLTAGAADNLSYDELNKLPFLDAVCRETLRLYPTITLSTRMPIQDTILSVGEPVNGVDGRVMKEITIPKGTEIVIGSLGCNANKEMWGEDALEFKPRRWIEGLPAAVTNAPIPGVYSNLMTFLGGKRACIGFKFSEMEMKVILSVMLTTFAFEPTDKPVAWNVSAVWYPTVGTESNIPEMPIKIRFLQEVSV
ncbi:cytochrome P450 [Wolfiporia cocos MD-104 SS10]|uniref:Cytochrome P450 n=1 Tax=Wolfiporia cocos (strain MD-104) TaxID=742152 RepID=A0A2H3JWI9_WOLCO|nr:cytochrome P450 [Wolfiporia cocos MD-104 SS10]